ncbi:unnamed protein product [Parnassius mnemosyne]|uniref:Uncharacterized protein n=1 Tax=Parnassius mnemosyne TaxID=213953 RepID=A0AAV1LUE0_9NEOP
MIGTRTLREHSLTYATRVRSPPAPIKLLIAILSAYYHVLGGEGKHRKETCMSEKISKACEVRQHTLRERGGHFLALKPSQK